MSKRYSQTKAYLAAQERDRLYRMEVEIERLQAELAELREVDSIPPGCEPELACYPSPYEIRAAIERMAWQYGECSGLQIAAEFVREAWSDTDFEDFAQNVNQQYLEPDNAWECKGNTGFERIYHYDETAAFVDIRNMSDLPKNCSTEHKARILAYLARESARATGFSGKLGARTRFLHGPLGAKLVTQ